MPSLRRRPALPQLIDGRAAFGTYTDATPRPWVPASAPIQPSPRGALALVPRPASLSWPTDPEPRQGGTACQVVPVDRRGPGRGSPQPEVQLGDASRAELLGAIVQAPRNRSAVPAFRSRRPQDVHLRDGSSGDAPPSRPRPGRVGLCGDRVVVLGAGPGRGKFLNISRWSSSAHWLPAGVMIGRRQRLHLWTRQLPGALARKVGEQRGQMAHSFRALSGWMPKRSRTVRRISAAADRSRSGPV